MILLGPALAVGGILRIANHRQVNGEIEQRHSSLPLAIAPGEVQPLNSFFPLAPAPQHLVIVYNAGGSEYRLLLDTREALGDLHLKSSDD